MVRYPEAVSILEGTWNTISSGYPSGPIVWGEKGALIVENGGDHGIHANVCVYLDRYSTTPSKVYCSDDYPLPEEDQPGSGGLPSPGDRRTGTLHHGSQ